MGRKDAQGDLDPAEAPRQAKPDLAEAPAFRAATSEVPGIISRSFGDAQPVFDMIVQQSVRLCEASFGVVLRYDGIGTCGKDGRGVPVGVGQPTMKLDRLTVGGTAA
jgi:hypothetical protein